MVTSDRTLGDVSRPCWDVGGRNVRGRSAGDAVHGEDVPRRSPQAVATSGTTPLAGSSDRAGIRTGTRAVSVSEEEPVTNSTTIGPPSAPASADLRRTAWQELSRHRSNPNDGRCLECRLDCPCPTRRRGCECARRIRHVAASSVSPHGRRRRPSHLLAGSTEGVECGPASGQVEVMPVALGYVSTPAHLTVDGEAGRPQPLWA